MRAYSVTGLCILALAQALFGRPHAVFANSDEKKEEKPADAHGDAKKDDHGDAKKDDHGAKKDDGHGGAAKAPAKEVTPLPRWIKGPKIYFDGLEEGSGRVNYNYKSARYTFLGVLGTWNKRSNEIAQLLNVYADEFKIRNISIVTIFSHDTPSTVLDFKKVTGAKFLLGLAPVEFIDELQNPRVPTFWLMNNLGNTLFYSELPENAEIETILKKLLRWTEF